MEDWREQLYGKKWRRYDDSSDSKDENRTGDEQYVSLSQLCEDIY
jgi:hypothetical protein